MAYMSVIQFRPALPANDQAAPAVIPSRCAADAANILLARSPVHARRFALAMHRRVAKGLDSQVIEHWARVVMEIDRITPRPAGR